MKKLLLVVLVVTLVGLSFGLATAKGPDNPKRMGAVKIDLTSRNSAYTGSGWVVVNTNCEGIVKANVHLEGAPASETYAIFIVVGSDWQGVDGSITTEENGKGAGYAEQTIPESQILEDNTINVKIVVRPEPGSSGDGWASQVVNIPVKAICEDL